MASVAMGTAGLVLEEPAGMWDVMGKMVLFRVLGDEGDGGTQGWRGSTSVMGGRGGCCWWRQER